MTFAGLLVLIVVLFCFRRTIFGATKAVEQHLPDVVDNSMLSLDDASRTLANTTFKEYDKMVSSQKEELEEAKKRYNAPAEIEDFAELSAWRHATRKRNW